MKWLPRSEQNEAFRDDGLQREEDMKARERKRVLEREKGGNGEMGIS